jgi:septal ring factor EnvC (AmiA/AmiB activator)
MNYLILGWFLIWLYKQFPSKGIKAQFKKKLAAGKWGYAQLEFESYVAADRRETIRKEFDRVNESIDAYQQQVDNKNNKPETIKLFQDKITETQKSVDELKERLADADRGIALAEETKDELHHQEELLKTFIENNY